jgi:hypothetical protein
MPPKPSPARLIAPPPPAPFAHPTGAAVQMRPAAPIPGRSGVLQGAFRGAMRLVQPSGRAGAARLPDGMSLPSGGGAPLPDSVRQKMEGFFKTDFSDVRIHIGPQAPAIGAIAFTIGSQIFFAPGQYQPGSPNGQALLGHELTHVVQQRAGRVRNPFGGGIAVVQDHALEREADEMGRRAALSQASRLPV